MATRPNYGSASALPPPAMLESAIRRLSRSELADLCEQLIDRLDHIDGDSDFEPDDFDTAVDDGPCDEDTDSEPEDYGDEFADPIARAEHRRRIKQTRCKPIWSRYSARGRPEVIGHRLFDEPTVPTQRQLLKRKRGVPRRPRG